MYSRTSNNFFVRMYSIVEEYSLKMYSGGLEEQCCNICSSWWFRTTDPYFYHKLSSEILNSEIGGENFLGSSKHVIWTEKVSWWLGQVSYINQVVKKKKLKNLKKLKKSSGNLREEKQSFFLKLKKLSGKKISKISKSWTN